MALNLYDKIISTEGVSNVNQCTSIEISSFQQRVFLKHRIINSSQYLEALQHLSRTARGQPEYVGVRLSVHHDWDLHPFSCRHSLVRRLHYEHWSCGGRLD